MTIHQDEIDSIKQGIDLVPFMKACGIELTQVGGNYRGLCPFHEDTTPSLTVNPKENLWNCFGCDKGGDNIRFVQLFDNLSFNDAVKRLKNYFPGGELPTNQKKTAVKKEKKAITIQDQKLLARVVGYYQHTFTEDPRGVEYLTRRGITDVQSCLDFGVGFVNGSLKNILPEDPEVVKTLTQHGILNAKGNETFYNCVIFPIHDNNGGIVNLYGRNISEESGVSHLYLGGSRPGAINHQAVRKSSTIILTESIIDALTLYDQGFKNVFPAYGVNGLTDDHLALFVHGAVREIYICFDSDTAGKQGAARTAEQLKKKGITPYIVELPEKDINIFFKRHTPEELEELFKKANPESVEQSDSLNKRKQSFYTQEEHGFTVGYGMRHYQVKGIQRGDTQLKATIKVAKDVKATNAPFELTTIDLYSSRSRHWFAKLCAGLFDEPEALLREDISRVLQLVEEWQPQEQRETITISKQDKDLAMSFLNNPDMFSELLADFRTMGVTGEETNKLVGYLAASSRKLAKPLSVFIQSRSAAGKSTLQDAILSLIPPEDFEKYTRMSDQALFYKEEDSLVHKILAIEEAEGMGGAAYSIRNLQSAREISVAVTGKHPGTGKMRTERYKVKGPVCVMITTTATEIDQETASRFIFLTIDESSSMTEAIHGIQREAETLEGLVQLKKQDGITRKHHAAGRLLRPLQVVNPYTAYLTYPAHALRTRRDHPKYLGLIRAVAFIHQYQREVKTIEVDGEPVEYIEVTLDDIDKANTLANEVLGQTMDELATPSRTLLTLAYTMVHELAEQGQLGLDQIFFTRRQLREYTGWTDWQIKTHIKQLEEMEYLVARVGHKGKEYSYILNYQGQAENTERCCLGLTTVDELKRLLKPGGEKG